MNERIGIVYYSNFGNGEFVVSEFQKRLGAKVFKIDTKQHLRGKKIFRVMVGGFQVIMKKTPPLKEYEFDQDNFDVLIIESPVWVDSFAPAIRSFLKTEKIKDKKIFLVCCYENSIENTFLNLKEELEGNKFIGEVAFKKALKNREETISTIDYLVNKMKEENQ